MTVKHLVAIAIAIAVALVGATAVGISAVEHSATKVRTPRRHSIGFSNGSPNNPRVPSPLTTTGICSSSCRCVRRVSCRANTTRALPVCVVCVCGHSLVVHQSLGPMQRFRRQQKLEVVSKSPPQLKCVQACRSVVVPLQ